MYPRHLRDSVVAALSDSPVVFLNGARQVGKSTLAQDIAASEHPARYMTFDDLGVLAAAKSDPQGFLAGLSGPVILDEIQRVPELFIPLKAAVDRDRAPGRFLLTGSAGAMVLPRLAQPLTGRMEMLTLWPLSQGELAGRREGFIDAMFDPGFSPDRIEPADPGALWERVARGGYPEPVRRPGGERRRAWLDSYIAAILEREVRELSAIEGLSQLPRLLRLLAARTAGLLNFSELSRAMGLPQSTLKRYFALLEATFLIRRLPPWSRNLGRRLVKAPKLHFNDSGLAAALLGADAARIRGDGALSGPLLETFAAAELAKQAAWSRTRPRLHYWRAQTGPEVDIVLEEAGGRCVGVEIKAGSAGPGDAKGLRALAEGLGKNFVRGVVLHAGPETIPFAKNLHALPLGALWSL